MMVLEDFFEFRWAVDVLLEDFSWYCHWFFHGDEDEEAFEIVIDEDDYFLLTAADEFVTPLRYYRTWTDTFPMLIFFIAFFTNSFLFWAVLIIGYYDELEFFTNVYHMDEYDEEDHVVELDEYDEFEFAFEFEFFDMHSYKEFEFFMFLYTNHRYALEYKY